MKLFSRPSVPTMPPVVSVPEPVVETGQEEDQAILSAKRRSGFRKTILTGELEPAGQGKKLLGD